MNLFTASTLPAEISRRLVPAATSSLILPIDERLHLRQLEPAHADELFRVVDANRAHLRQWLPWLDGNRSSSDSLIFIESTLRQAAARDGFQAAIIRDGQIVGVIGHHRIDWENRLTTIGYWLAERWQGQGIATTACRAVVAHAFETLGLNRVQICCATENSRSRAIPERLGFTREGIHREAEWLYDHFVDHAVYARLRRDAPSGD
jgi:ribosomal-protein-serine acetyltransferase